MSLLKKHAHMDKNVMEVREELKSK